MLPSGLSVVGVDFLLISIWDRRNYMFFIVCWAITDAFKWEIVSFPVHISLNNCSCFGKGLNHTISGLILHCVTQWEISLYLYLLKFCQIYQENRSNYPSFFDFGSKSNYSIHQSCKTWCIKIICNKTTWHSTFALFFKVEIIFFICYFLDLSAETYSSDCQKLSLNSQSKFIHSQLIKYLLI